MINELKEFKQLLLKINDLEQEIEKKAEKIRSYYKYQNEETDSISEDFIVTVVNRYGWDEADEFIDSLIEYEGEDD